MHRVALEKEMMEPGADLEQLEGEFHEIDEAENTDKATERKFENERVELMCLVQGPSEVDNIDMEDKMAVTQGKETEGESEKDEDEGEEGESMTLKRMLHQSVYVAVPPMKAVGKGMTGDRGPVSTEF